MNLEYILDLRYIKSFEEFVAKCNESFIESVGGKWDGNLDAFNDYLSWPENVPYNLLILGEDNCKDVLGYERRTYFLEGKTLWDEILEIFSNNSEFVHVVFKK